MIKKEIVLLVLTECIEKKSDDQCAPRKMHKSKDNGVKAIRNYLAKKYSYLVPAQSKSLDYDENSTK